MANEDFPNIDVTDSRRFAGYCILYLFYGFLDAMWQTYAYWLMGYVFCIIKPVTIPDMLTGRFPMTLANSPILRASTRVSKVQELVSSG